MMFNQILAWRRSPPPRDYAGLLQRWRDVGAEEKARQMTNATRGLADQ